MDLKALSIVVLAPLSLASAAFAQHTRVVCEASDDYGQTWRDTLTVWPGERVDVRVRIELVNSYNHFVQGLCGVTFQPILTGWEPELGDSVVPFSFPGLDLYGNPTTETSYQGRQIADSLGATGRIAPFGTGIQGPTSACGLLTAFQDAGNILRFAGSRNTTMLTNVAWGVATSQYPPSLVGTLYAYNVSPVVFRYAVTIGSRRAPLGYRTLVAYVPFESISGHVAKYHYCGACTSVWQVPILPTSILSATIAVRQRCVADLVGSVQPNPADPSEPPRQYPDGAVNLDDLLYFLDQFEQGSPVADIVGGVGPNATDGAVTIEDLVYFLARYEAGC